MTNEELLQKAKDQAAQKVSWSSFDHAAENAAVWDLNEITNEAMKIYAELAIQSAREEAEPELLEALRGMVEHYEKFTANWNHDAYLKAKKLTAPGR